MNKQNTETDLEMLKRVGIRFLILFLVIANIDTLFDWSLGLLDLLFEYLHIVVEIVEYSLELVIDEIFSTGHHVSEIILVNGVIIFSIYQTYRLCKAAPRILERNKRKLIAARLIKKRRRLAYWHSLNMASKIKLVSAYSLGIFCILFWVTL